MSRGCYLVPMAMDWAGPFSWELVLPGSKSYVVPAMPSDQKWFLQNWLAKALLEAVPAREAGFQARTNRIFWVCSVGSNFDSRMKLCKQLHDHGRLVSGSWVLLQLPRECFTVIRTCVHKGANPYSILHLHTLQFPTNVNTWKWGNYLSKFICPKHTHTHLYYILIYSYTHTHIYIYIHIICNIM